MDYKFFLKRNWKLIAAIIYLLSPFDFLPEFFLGPVGYIDDVGILIFVFGQRFLTDYLKAKLDTSINKGEIKLKKRNID